MDRLSVPLALSACLLAAACGSSDEPATLGQSTPSPTSASPAAGTREVPALWALDAVSADRREVVIRVGGGGCLSYDRTDVVEEGDTLRLKAVNQDASVPDGGCAANFTAFPHRVTLPRALRVGEMPVGECESTGDGVQATHCKTLKEFAAASE